MRRDVAGFLAAPGRTFIMKIEIALREFFLSIFL
jgi:hypothetical protein